MIRGLLLDLDDTLLDDSHAMGHAIEAFAATRGWQGEALAQRWVVETERQWQRHRDGEITFQEQRRERLRAVFGRPFGADEADAMFEAYLRVYEGHWRPVAELQAFLDRTPHLPKVVVSNGMRAQALRKLAALQLSQHLIGVVTPEDAGAPKPQPAMFLRGAQLLGLPPAHCAMIGDNHAADIAPALALGMQAFHVVRGRAGAGLLDALAALT